METPTGFAGNSLAQRLAPFLLLLLACLASLAIGPCEDDDESQGAIPGAGSAPIDPLPGMSTPGLVTCDGCPEPEGITDFEPDFGNASAHVFEGNVQRSRGNGRFYVVGDDGEAYGGNIETDEASGRYSVNVPLICGPQTVKLAWENEAGTGGAIYQVETSGCVSGDIRITLSWDDVGSDFELHLIREGGTINDNADDCTWTSCIGQSPDWGRSGDATDNPSKDVDDTNAFGPENIVYPDPAPGTYTVLVEHWGAGGAGATGTVVINVRGQPPVELKIDGLDPQHVFIVATIEWPSGEITPIQEDFDCTATWAGGCRAEMP